MNNDNGFNAIYGTSGQTKEALQTDIELAKGITELTRVTDTAISILARAILELEDPEGHHHLPNNTRKALQALVSRFNDAG
jgi:hypothetical protein